MSTVFNKDFKRTTALDAASGRRVPAFGRVHWTLLAVVAVIGASMAGALTRGEATPQAGQATLPGPLKTQALTLPQPPIQGIDAALTDVPEPRLRVYEYRVEPGDTMSGLFDRSKLSANELYAVLRVEELAARAKAMRPGDRLVLKCASDGRLQELVYEHSPHARLRLWREATGFRAAAERDPIEKRIAFAHGVIDDSLYLAGVQAGLDEAMIMDLATVFGWDIDFALDVRSGDEFTVIYESRYKAARHVGNGPILAAEFVNQGRRHRAVRYTDENGRADYYSPDGSSVRKAFLRTPVDFARISSKFTTRRQHPVLNRMRAHRGVDYAAPTGTQVRSTGDGRIEFLGKKGGYGKVVIVRHTDRYATLYAHLSRFKAGLGKGKRVEQGQIIGYVGQTGLATGPHLHYEFLVNGAQRNPLTIELPGAQPLPDRYRADFAGKALLLLGQLDALNRNRPILHLTARDQID